MIYTEKMTGSEAVEVPENEAYLTVLREEYESLLRENRQLSEKLRQANQNVDKLEKKQEELEKTIDMLQHDLDVSQMDADHYVALAYSKERYALELEQKLQGRETGRNPSRRSLFRRIAGKARKVPGFIKRKLGGLKRRIKRLLGRG